MDYDKQILSISCAGACDYDRRSSSYRVRGAVIMIAEAVPIACAGAMDYDKQILCSFASVSLERMPAQSALFERSELARGADNRHSKGEQQNKQNLRS